ncbi:MAG: deoxyribodipyrimidine photolyase, partial [Erythrobacter sp. 34-65-8]
MIQIVWLRRDLRLGDNPALHHAAKAGPIVAVYALDDARAKGHAYGGASRWWLHHSLVSLARALEAKGSRLILRCGDAVEELCKVAAELGATTVHANRHYEPWWRKAQGELAERLDLQLHDANYLLPPGAVTTGSGTPYKIYTPFAKATLEQLPPRDVLPEPETLAVPERWPASDALEDWNLLPTRPDWAGGMRDFWQVGEAAAHERLDWWTDHVTDYDEARNLPSVDKTSQLSPHLHFGEISPRQIWNAMANAGLPAHCDEHVQHYRNELGWREFSHHLLFHYPHTPERNLDARFDGFAWATPDPAVLTAWQRGCTGVPLVDAGMRELWHTGWMHNRVRMVVASFLCKNLRIHWSHGARWFWDTLLDADLAANTQGWQWSAGTGADAAPYFRIFSPASQAARFD